MTGTKKGLDATTIKMIAIIAMVIDHIAWKFVPMSSGLGQLMHAVGRLTGPIMCYFIAEGYRHTRSVRKYMERLFVFAAISVIPFSYFETGTLNIYSFGMIFTLALGLAAIAAYEQISNPFLKWLAIAGLCLASMFGDWPIFGIAMCLIFHIYHDQFRDQVIAMGIMIIIMMVLMISPYKLQEISLGEAMFSNIYQLAVMVPVFLLRLYNGERGGGKYSGWFFYVFYPAHLVILGFLYYSVFK